MASGRAEEERPSGAVRGEEMTQQEQFEADYLAACPKHGEQTIAKYKLGKHIGKYVNQVTRTAFKIWLQQAKRHEAEIAELVAAAVPSGEFPHEEMDAIALGRFKVEQTDSNIWGWCVRAGNGELELYKGRKSECASVARKLIGAFLDGAFLAYERFLTAPQFDTRHSQRGPRHAFGATKMTTLDAAAAAEIERLKKIVKIQREIYAALLEDLEESERQRKILAEQLERIGRAGIDAAVGAGK